MSGERIFHAKNDENDENGLDSGLKFMDSVLKMMQTSGYSGVLEAPIFRPTEKEFRNPMAYIDAIK